MGLLKSPITEPPKSSLKIYKRIGVGFICLTAILLLIVMYMALSRATIIVVPEEKPISADLLVTVKEKDLQGGDVLGKLGITTVSREATFISSGGDGAEVPAKASGEITIYNASQKSQPLIATTRFLSKDGILFRLQKDVMVPAGGNVKAVILADKEGKNGEVPPGTFTIPGLAAGLQSKIYGKSTEPTAGGMARVGIITEKDIDEAVKNLTFTLLVEAKDKLKPLLNLDSQFAGVAYKEIIKNKEMNIKAGEAAPNFKVKLEFDVIGVAYSSGLQEQAAKTLSNIIDPDRKLVSSNLLEFQPTIEKYDLEDPGSTTGRGGSANLKVTLTGKTIINADSPVFNRDKLAGMNVLEVKEYLEKYAGIKNVEVKFFPFWIDRVPKLRDHIKVIVQ